MFASRTSQVMAGLLVVLILLYSVGCEDDDDGGSGGLNAVTVTFENWDFATFDYWIIISSADGSMPLAAKRIEENGTFEIGSGIPGRFTFSGAWKSQYGMKACYSYMNTAERDWLLRQTVLSGEGDVWVTAAYPAGQYDDLQVQGSFSYGHYFELGDSSAQVMVPAIRPESNNRVSFLGVIYSEVPEHCGWIVDQPFNPDSANSYHLVLDQPLSTHVITSTRSLTSISLNGIRGSNYAPYYLGSAQSPGDQSFTMTVPEFPADAYWLRGEMTEGHVAYAQWQKTTGEMPTALAVSDASVSMTFDSTENLFRDVTVQGEADAVWGMWGRDGMTPELAWMVTADPGATTIARPALPDSIFELLEADPQTLGLLWAGMYDYTPVTGYDEYMVFSSNANSPYIYGRCEGVYQYLLNGAFAAPQEISRMKERWMPAGMGDAAWILGTAGLDSLP